MNDKPFLIKTLSEKKSRKTIFGFSGVNIFLDYQIK